MPDAVRVLLVDDETLFLESMSKVLRGRGYNVSTAPGGAEAIEEITSRPYDVVILDLRMPNIDGMEVLKRIRKDFPLLPVILLSGHADVSRAVEAMQHGAVDYLLKPAPILKLCERIQSSLEHRRVLEEMGLEKGEE
jgi:DNA-binding NtrC family response regulator